MAEYSELDYHDPPDYMNREEREWEALLSQCGNFTPDQRTIFHNLCERKISDLSYDQYIQGAKLDVRYLPAELQKLMERLRQREYGLITTRIQDGKRKPDRIILTEQGDARFYYHLLGEEFVNLAEKIQSPFPYLGQLQKKKIDIPADFLQKISSGELNSTFFQEQSAGIRIFSLDTVDKQTLAVPGNQLKRLVSFSIGKLQNALQGADLLEQISRLQSASLGEIKKKAGTKDPHFWKGLTETILKNKKDLAQEKKLRLSRGFFQAAGILSAFVENQINETRRIQAEEKERNESLKAVEQMVLQSEKKILDPQELDEMIQKAAGGQGGDLKEEFLNRYATSSKRGQIPPLILIDQRYIHKESVYPVFVESLSRYAEDLYKDYVDRMEYLLKSHKSDESTVFISKKSFREDIQSKLEKMDPFFTALLERPQVFSEAVIYTARKKMKIDDVDKIKELLTRYFKEDKVEFKPVDELLGLDSLSIFESAFLRLPLFRQLMIRIMGRYSSYQEQFLGQRGQEKTAPKVKKKDSMDSLRKNSQERKRRPPSKTKAGKGAAGEGRSSRAGNSQKGKSASGSGSGSGSKDHEIRPSSSAAERRYTKRDQDEAWGKFIDSFKK